MTDTPELDKQRACNEPRKPFDVLTDFYDWMVQEGIVLATYGRVRERSMMCGACKGRRFDPDGLTAREQQLLARGALPDEEREPCPRCEGRGREWVTEVDDDSLEPHRLHGSPEALFARFWELDLDKISAEREELLAELRRTAPPRCKICAAAVRDSTAPGAFRGVCDQPQCLEELERRVAAQKETAKP